MFAAPVLSLLCQCGLEVHSFGENGGATHEDSPAFNGQTLCGSSFGYREAKLAVAVLGTLHEARRRAYGNGSQDADLNT
jgi:hypothetical protein